MKLTIVVPVYSERLYLPEVFRRILSATYPEQISSQELIAIDDGSSDGSWEWLKTFAARGFDKEGQGPVSQATLHVLRHERNIFHYLALLICRKICRPTGRLEKDWFFQGIVGGELPHG